jgi:hypothetical protein
MFAKKKITASLFYSFFFIHKEIHIAIKNASGARTSLFVPEAAFDALVRRQIMLLEEPALECVEHIFDELHQVLEQINDRDLSYFNRLHAEVLDAVHQLLVDNRTPTREMIRNLIKIELAYINTAHPDFVGGDRAMLLVNDKITKELALMNGVAGVQQQSSMPIIPASTMSSNQQPGQPQTMRCFLCDTELPNDPAAVNAHIDQCLSKQEGSNPSSPPASDGSHPGMFRSWFGGKPQVCCCYY